MWIRSTLIALMIVGCVRRDSNMRPLVANTPPATSQPATAPAPPEKPQTPSRPAVTLAAAPEEPPPMVEKPARSPIPLSLQVEATVKLQPKKARTSANLVEGSVDDLAFFGEHSEYLVGGGNDDRVHLAEIASGREIWVSKKLGKDIQAVAACGEFFAGSTYHNRLALYQKTQNGRVRTVSTSRYGGNEWLAFTEDCQHLLMPEFLGQLFIYKRKSGALAAELPSDGYRSFGYSNGRVVYRRRGDDQQEHYILYTWDQTPAQGTTRELPYVTEDDDLGLLVQVQPTPWGGLLREYCDRERCRVILGDRDQVVDFAIVGGVWSLSLGSELALSRGGEFLAWYRDGLPVTIVELATGKRATLPPVQRTMSATVTFAFDPLDAHRLAVAMDPTPNKATVYRLGDAPITGPNGSTTNNKQGPRAQQ